MLVSISTTGGDDDDEDDIAPSSLLSLMFYGGIHVWQLMFSVFLHNYGLNSRILVVKFWRMLQRRCFLWGIFDQMLIKNLKENL